MKSLASSTSDGASGLQVQTEQEGVVPVSQADTQAQTQAQDHSFSEAQLAQAQQTQAQAQAQAQAQRRELKVEDALLYLDQVSWIPSAASTPPYSTLQRMQTR
jgi:histone deacetylase complex regulatory component SIN3